MRPLVQQKQSMKIRRDASPLTPAELIALRRLLRQPVVEQSYSAAQVASLLGYRSKRTVLNMVREGVFPHAFKPAFNMVRIPVSDVLAFQEARRVRTFGLDESRV
jgi:hypothetical protein